MPPNESAGFVAAGFSVSERLHLLERVVNSADRRATPVPSGVELRRGRTADIDRVLAVDARCFGSFWQLDLDGVQDARSATASARFRLAFDQDRLIGYAITGRQGRSGYLQRLAVDPECRRSGVGTALVLDGVRWLAMWRATSVLVNTQETNTTALALYERLAFHRKPEGLAVFSAPLAQ